MRRKTYRHLNSIAPSVRFVNIRSSGLSPSVALALLGLNLITAAWWPVPWTDEALFLDPAANWFFENKFTSSVWQTQPYGEFWISNAPLYSLLLAGWLKIFGFGLVQSRALNLFLQCLLVWICIIWSERALHFKPWQSLVLALLLALPNSMAFMARNGRYDTLACLTATLLAVSLDKPYFSRVSLIVSGILIPWISLPSLALTTGLAWFMSPKKAQGKAASLHLGSALFGFLALYLFVNQQVSGSRFLRILGSLWLSPAAEERPKALLLLDNLTGLTSDRFWLVALPAMITVLILRQEALRFWAALPRTLQRWMAAGLLACGACIFIYKMNILYFWMIAVPLAFVFTFFLGWGRPKPLVFKIATAGLLLLLGLPFRLYLGQAQNLTVEQNKNLIASLIKTTEPSQGFTVIYAEWPFYYEVKKKGILVIGPKFVGAGVGSSMTPEFLVLEQGSLAPESLKNFRRVMEAPSPAKTEDCLTARHRLLAKIESGPINKFPVAEIRAP